MATIGSLADEEFDSGHTLCYEWSPRDVLAHLIGTSDIGRYIRHGLHVHRVNALAVADGRKLSRAELTARGHVWAAHPTLAHRLAARALIGDVAIHHQDVLRGLGRKRDVPADVVAAIFREGVMLSAASERNLLKYRVEPTTAGGRPLGRGRLVRGSAESLGLWLAGRTGLEDELDFAS
jgi:uncharacterized protein (TIGR03083 family)